LAARAGPTIRAGESVIRTLHPLGHIDSPVLGRNVQKALSSAGRSEFMANPKPAYTGTAILLHWLVVALLVAQFAVAWTMPDIGRDTPQTILISLHFSLGVLILFVAVIRLLCRATQRQPESQRLVCCRGRCGRRAPSIGCSTRS
jgi:hypothetical protein